MRNLMILMHSVNDSLQSFLLDSAHTTYGEKLNVYGISVQPSCFDWSGFVIAIFACVVAIITCVFTILMYRYVKKQLDLAKEQLDKQIEENEKNEAERKESMTKTTRYVEQVKNQILNNTLVNLVEKKQNFLQDYDYLYSYLSENPDLLKKGKVYQKVGDLRKTIDDIIVRLDSIKDILGLFIIQNDSLINSYDSITNSIDELKNKEIIAHNMIEGDEWLNNLLKNKENLTDEIENAIEQIKNDIKFQKL